MISLRLKKVIRNILSFLGLRKRTTTHYVALLQDGEEGKALRDVLSTMSSHQSMVGLPALPSGDKEKKYPGNNGVQHRG